MFQMGLFKKFSKMQFPQVHGHFPEKYVEINFKASLSILFNVGTCLLFSYYKILPQVLIFSHSLFSSSYLAHRKGCYY